MSQHSRRVDLDERAVEFIHNELRGKPHDLAKFLCEREFATSKAYCFAASDCDQQELYKFRSGYGFKAADDIDKVLAAALSSRSTAIVRPILLMCSPFSTEQRAHLDLGFSTLASGQYVYWCADLTTENQRNIAKLVGFAGFTSGNVGVLTSGCELPDSICGGEVSESMLRGLAKRAVLLLVSVYDGSNYLLCEL